MSSGSACLPCTFLSGSAMTLEEGNAPVSRRDRSAVPEEEE